MYYYPVRRMTEGEAREQIIAACAPDCSPILSDDDVDLLINLAREIDEFGILPFLSNGDINTNWQPTWYINRAINKGWKLKAAKCAGAFDYSDSDLKLSRSQMIKNCLEMAKLYPVNTSVSTPSDFGIPFNYVLNSMENID